MKYKKSRPCLVLSPDEMNDNISTVIIAPMTTKSHSYPTRVSMSFQGKNGWIVLDQIRTIDRKRIIKRFGTIDNVSILKLKNIIKEMLVD
jgi:mRNA interferase MazF